MDEYDRSQILRLIEEALTKLRYAAANPEITPNIRSQVMSARGKLEDAEKKLKDTK